MRVRFQVGLAGVVVLFQAVLGRPPEGVIPQERRGQGGLCAVHRLPLPEVRHGPRTVAVPPWGQPDMELPLLSSPGTTLKVELGLAYTPGFDTEWKAPSGRELLSPGWTLTFPHIAHDTSGCYFYIERGRYRFPFLKDGGGSYEVGGKPNARVRVNGATVLLRFNDGRELRFAGFTEAVPPPQRGKPLSYENPYRRGNRAVRFVWNEQGLLERIEEGDFRTWYFSYERERLSRVEMRRRDDFLLWSAAFHYGPGRPDEAESSLLCVRRSLDGFPTRFHTTYFAYYREGEEKGLLAGIIGPAAAARLGGRDPEDIPQAELLGACNVRFSYALREGEPSVVVTRCEGSGCSACGSARWHASSFSYVFYPRGRYDTVASHVVVEQDNRLKEVDFNSYGLPLRVSYRGKGSSEPCETWEFAYDRLGRVTHIVYPPGGSDSYKRTRGGDPLVRRFQYDGQGRLLSEELGRLSLLRDPKGAGWVTLRRYLYSGSGPFPVAEERYPHRGEGPVVTRYQYEYHGPEEQLRVVGMRRIIPAVPEAENGSGAGSVEEYRFDPETGLLLLDLTEAAVTVSYQYDPETEQVTTELKAPETEALLVRRFYDPWGRLSATEEPDGALRPVIWGVLADNRQVRLTWPVARNGTAGPVSLVVYDQEGRPTEKAKGVPEAGLRPEEAFENDALSLQQAWHGSLSEVERFAYHAGRLVSREKLLTATGTRKAQWRYRYDAGGNLVQVETPDGTVRRFLYDAAGKLLEVLEGSQAEAGSFTQIEERAYTEDGLLLWVATPRGPETGPSGDDRLVLFFQYDWRRRPVAVVRSSDGFLRRVTYDNLDRVIRRSAVPPGSEEETLLEENFYDARGHLWKQLKYSRDSEGARQTYLYWHDPGGRVAKILYPGGVFQKRCYDPLGRLVALRYGFDPAEAQGLGRERYREAISSDTCRDDVIVESEKWTYDRAGRVLLQTHYLRPEGQERLGPLTDLPGAVALQVAYWYDPLGREAVEVVHGGEGVWPVRPPVPPSGGAFQIKRFFYDFWGRVQKVVLPDGRTRTFSYDEAGRLICEKRSSVSREEDAAPLRIERAYDSAGRVVRERFSWESSSGLQARETAFFYGVGRSDPLPSELASGRFLQAVYHRDPHAGAGSQHTERFAYDALGRVIRYMTGCEATGDVVEHRYEYDVSGRLLLDSVERVGSSRASVRSVAYTYDQWGRLQSVRCLSDPGGMGRVLNEVAWHYNGFGQRHTSFQEHDGMITSLTEAVRYRWSEARGAQGLSVLKTIEYPGEGVSLHYTYGSTGVQGLVDQVLGRVSAVAFGGKLLAEYTWQGLRELRAREVHAPHSGLSILTQRRVNSFGWLSELTTDLTYGGVKLGALDHRNYRYDSGGRVLREDWASCTGSGSGDRLRLYDDMGRLSFTATGLLRHGVLYASESPQRWVLDGAGNWEQYYEDNRFERRSHDAFNRVVLIGEGEPLRYDGRGNLRSALGVRFYYDAWSRLVGLQAEDGTELAVVRDGLGRPIREVVRKPQGGKLIRDLYWKWPWQLLSVVEKEGQREIREDYVWGVARVDELLLWRRVEGTAERLHPVIQDGLGNVVALCNELGIPVERYSYSPYGKSTVLDPFGRPRRAGSSLRMPFRFHTRRLIAGEIYDFRHRLYWPRLGRFLSPDPLGIPFQGSLYAAPFGSSFSDPDGLRPRLRDCRDYGFNLPRVRVGLGLTLGGELSFNARVCDCCDQKNNQWIENGWAELKLHGELSGGYGAAFSVTIFGVSFGFVFELAHISFIECSGSAIIDACRGEPSGCVSCGASANVGLPVVRASGLFGSFYASGRLRASAEVFLCFGPEGMRRGLKVCWGWNVRIAVRILWFRRTWRFGSDFKCRTFPF